jgi:amidase
VLTPRKTLGLFWLVDAYYLCHRDPIKLRPSRDTPGVLLPRFCSGVVGLFYYQMELTTGWKTISSSAQQTLLESIPAKWRINTRSYDNLTDVSGVPITCGILSQKQIDITNLTVTELAKRIRSRKFKATEVLEAFAARAAIAHQLVGVYTSYARVLLITIQVFCLTDWWYDEALEDARRLDAIVERSDQPLAPLHGVPVAIKVCESSQHKPCSISQIIQDTYSVKGRVTTRGHILNKSNPVTANHDSDVVRIIREAGALFFCRTTMPQTGMVLETVSNLWGRTLNPYNRRLGSGGSSGGDGALIAMKGCPIAPSTDAGGSIRVPAAFNGLYGMRPTAMRIPKNLWEGTMSGQMAIRDSAGPICQSVDDIRLFTRLLTTNEQARYDTNAVPIPWRHVTLAPKQSFGIMKWDRVVMPQPPVLRAIEQTKNILLAAGHEGLIAKIRHKKEYANNMAVIEFEPPFDCWDLAKCYVQHALLL